MTDLDIAENFRARPDQYAMADFGMAVFVFLAGAAKGDAVQDRDIVFDNGGLTAYESCGVIEKDAAADLGCGIDIGLEDRRRPALQIIGKILAAFMIEPMRQTVGLQGMEALEVQQGIDEPCGRRIAVVHRHEVSAESVVEIGIVAQRLIISLTD